MKNNIFILSVFGSLSILLIVGCGNNKTQNNTVKIGLIVPLTGNASVVGEYSKSGIEMAVEEQNKKGGLLGKQIVLEIQDSKADPKEGVSILKNMLSEKQKPFLIYTLISGVTLAIKPETEKNGIILMSGVGTDKLLESSKYTIRNFYSATQISGYVSDFLKDEVKAKNIGIFYSNNEFGKSVNDAIEKKCEISNIEIKFSETYDDKNLDYKSLIASKVTNGIEYIYIVGIGKSLGTMIKQIREAGYKGGIVGDPLYNYPDVREAAGGSIKGLKVIDYSFDKNDTIASIKDFSVRYKQKYNKNPESFSAINYDAFLMLFNSINKSKKMDSDQIITDLNSIKEYTGDFGKISVNNRNVVHSFKLKTLNQ